LILYSAIFLPMNSIETKKLIFFQFWFFYYYIIVLGVYCDIFQKCLWYTLKFTPSNVWQSILQVGLFLDCAASLDDISSPSCWWLDCFLNDLRGQSCPQQVELQPKGGISDCVGDTLCQRYTLFSQVLCLYPQSHRVHNPHLALTQFSVCVCACVCEQYKSLAACCFHTESQLVCVSPSSHTDLKLTGNKDIFKS
jgi:hypothetical protein